MLQGLLDRVKGGVSIPGRYSAEWIQSDGSKEQIELFDCASVMNRFQITRTEQRSTQPSDEDILRTSLALLKIYDVPPRHFGEQSMYEHIKALSEPPVQLIRFRPDHSDIERYKDATVFQCDSLILDCWIESRVSNGVHVLVIRVSDFVSGD